MAVGLWLSQMIQLRKDALDEGCKRGSQDQGTHRHTCAVIPSTPQTPLAEKGDDPHFTFHVKCKDRKTWLLILDRSEPVVSWDQEGSAQLSQATPRIAGLHQGAKRQAEVSPPTLPKAQLSAPPLPSAWPSLPRSTPPTPGPRHLRDSLQFLQVVAVAQTRYQVGQALRAHTAGGQPGGGQRQKVRQGLKALRALSVASRGQGGGVGQGGRCPLSLHKSPPPWNHYT